MINTQYTSESWLQALKNFTEDCNFANLYSDAVTDIDDVEIKNTQGKAIPLSLILTITESFLPNYYSSKDLSDITIALDFLAQKKDNNNETTTKINEIRQMIPQLRKETERPLQSHDIDFECNDRLETAQLFLLVAESINTLEQILEKQPDSIRSYLKPDLEQYRTILPFQTRNPSSSLILQKILDDLQFLLELLNKSEKEISISINSRVFQQSEVLISRLKNILTSIKMTAISCEMMIRLKENCALFESITQSEEQLEAVIKEQRLLLQSTIYDDENGVQVGRKPLDTFIVLKQLEQKITAEEKIFITGYKNIPFTNENKAKIELINQLYDYQIDIQKFNKSILKISRVK